MRVRFTEQLSTQDYSWGAAGMGGAFSAVHSFGKPDYWQERSVHACTRTFGKMVRICKITAEKNILKLKPVVEVVVIACSSRPKVVYLKTVFSRKLTALSLNFCVKGRYAASPDRAI